MKERKKPQEPKPLPLPKNFNGKVKDVSIRVPGWRRSSRYLCSKCDKPVLVNPYGNEIRGCKKKGCRHVSLAPPKSKRKLGFRLRERLSFAQQMGSRDRETFPVSLLF